MSLTPAILETQSDSQLPFSTHPATLLHHARFLTGVDPRADQGHKVLAIDESRLNESWQVFSWQPGDQVRSKVKVEGVEGFFFWVSKMTRPGFAISVCTSENDGFPSSESTKSRHNYIQGIYVRFQGGYSKRQKKLLV